MNNPKHTDTKEAGRGTLRSYTTGFLFSIILTIDAYLLVVKHALSGNSLMFAIVSLAVFQLIIQLVFFLHLGRESKPRWNLTVFGFMAVVLVILVFGSLWIMSNLNYTHNHGTETPKQINDYIIQDEGIKP